MKFDEIGDMSKVSVKVKDDEYGRQFSTAKIIVTVVCAVEYKIPMIYYDNDLPITVNVPEKLFKGEIGYKSILKVDKDVKDEMTETTCSLVLLFFYFI